MKEVSERTGYQNIQLPRCKGDFRLKALDHSIPKSSPSLPHWKSANGEGATAANIESHLYQRSKTRAPYPGKNSVTLDSYGFGCYEVVPVHERISTDRRIL